MIPNCSYNIYSLPKSFPHKSTPTTAMAQAMGKLRGKDEAWVVLAAEPHATIGIGLRRVLTTDELRAAVLDGSIEQLLDWRTVSPGDVYHSPSDTIHAIGAGVTLVQ
jgi:mannose-6-phosphate isomerase